jgi:7-cyano-7-deazaguanine synthase
MLRAVVLLSGGLDSAVTLAEALERFTPGEVEALSIFYGQHHSVELEAAKAIADLYSVRHEQLYLMPSLFQGSGSAVVGESPVPRATYKELEKQNGPSETYVPFRNGLMLSMAAAHALRVKERASVVEVWYGAHAGDASRFAYPDCTPEFNGAMAAAMYVGTYHKIRLVTPLQTLTKADVVRIGRRLHTPFHLTHSCYSGSPACGECATCIERLEAFAANGLRDPIKYKEKKP